MPQSRISLKIIEHHVSAATGLSARQAHHVTRATVKSIIETLQTGQDVPLPGLGTLVVRPTPERTGIRPATGECLRIPAGRTVLLRRETPQDGD